MPFSPSNTITKTIRLVGVSVFRNLKSDTQFLEEFDAFIDTNLNEI